MKTSLRQDKSYPVIISLLFTLSVVCIGATVVLGEFILPLAISFYAALLTFERKKHILSLICAAVGFSMLFIPFTISAVWGGVSVICGILLYLLYRSGNAKSDTALILTFFLSAAIVFSFVLIAYKITGEFGLEPTIKYYLNLFNEFKAYFIESVMALSSSVSDKVGELAVPGQVGELAISEELLNESITLMFNMSISFIIIIAFLLSGLAIKLFTFIVRKNTEQNSPVHSWRFLLPSIYAYSFLIVFLLSSFVSPVETFGIVIINLSNIFTFIFVYIGFKAFKDLLSKKGKPVLGILIPILGVILLGNMAMDVLSVFGAVSTIMSNKKINKNVDVDENKK